MDSPLDTPPRYDLSTPSGRFRAQAYLNLVDHGFLRRFWTHLYEIAPGAWRSNQPSPARLERHAADGFKSVLRLRGQEDRAPYLLEREACERVGLTLHNVQVNGGRLSSKGQFLTLLDIFATIERPFVMHCKSGIDRTGLAAFLYLLAETDTDPLIARQQLSLKYLHLKSTRHGILDLMADTYLNAYRDSGINIRNWLETAYDAETMNAAYLDGQGRA